MKTLTEEKVDIKARLSAIYEKEPFLKQLVESRQVKFEIFLGANVFKWEGETRGYLRKIDPSQ